MVSRWVTGKTRGTGLKLLYLQKPACENAFLLLPVLTLLGSPGTCTALSLAARQGLPGTSLLHQQWWQLEEKYPDTSKMVIWNIKCEHSYYHVHKFGSAARLRLSSSGLSSLRLPVLKPSFRPLPRVLNGVIYSSCRLLPTEPHETEKK